MFSTFKQKLLLGIYIFILLSIPVGAYLVSQQQTIKSSASEPKTTKPKVVVSPKPNSSISPAKQLINASSQKVSAAPTPAPSESPSSSSPTIATNYGPTLSLKAAIDGRPISDYSTKLFIGIMEGTITSNPKFLLSFTVDLPASGQFSNLSLAGLTQGSTYTALLKGSAQIAAASTFTMTPAVSSLNEGNPIPLITGDLNEDNVINTVDYTIVQKILGATPTSTNWNQNADFNKDNVINTFDLTILNKNMNQIGASGAWTSPIPTKTASPSASLNTATGSPQDPHQNGTGQDGYWIWIPN